MIFDLTVNAQERFINYTRFEKIKWACEGREPEIPTVEPFWFRSVQPRSERLKPRVRANNDNLFAVRRIMTSNASSHV